MHVAVERARALAYFAALTIAGDDPRRRLAAAMAKASAGECQSLVFRHGLQLFGAMGFTWENDLQFALKRAKAGELLLGGAAEHRALIAEEYRAADVRSRGRGVPGRVLAFLDENLPTASETLSGRGRCRTCRPGRVAGSGCCSTTAGCCPASRRSSAAATPRVLQQFVYLEELCRRRIYHSFNPQGVDIIAASLMSFGLTSRSSVGRCRSCGPRSPRRWA